HTYLCVPSAAMEPFIDTFALESKENGRVGFLASSPEISLKKIFARALVQNPDYQGIYQICSVFRDDRPGKLHRPEFTLAEWYRKDATRQKMVADAHALVIEIARALFPDMPSPALDELDLRTIFGEKFRSEYKSYSELYQKQYGKLPSAANALDCEIASFNLLFDEWVLPILRVRPGLVAVSGFPPCLAALAKIENGVAARTELFCCGIEIANAYDEEHDPKTIRQRWQEYNELRALRGAATHPIDEELLVAAPSLQGVSGIALGLERVLCALEKLQ
ncbi:MAG: hypothetical protein N2Z22_11240, partial [Turneriella sp.]|nr:hypothetical protein [Turneriella sp.]